MPIIFVATASPAVAAELASLIEDAVERARRVDGWRPSADAARFVGDLRSMAQTYRESEVQKAQVRKHDVASNVARTMVKTSRLGTVFSMTTAEIAEAQGVSAAAVAARCRRGTVPGATLTPRGWRIPSTYVKGAR